MNSSNEKSSTTYPGPFAADTDQWILSTVLKTQAQTLGNRIAIDFVDGDSWSYADCLNEGRNCAAILSRLNIRAKQNVVVMVEDPADFCRLWFGLSLIGAVMVALNTGLKGQVLEHQIANANPALIVTDEPCQEAVTQAAHAAASSAKIKVIQKSKPGDTSPHQVRNLPFEVARVPGDIACIMYTSGTSGPSKGVLMPEAHCYLFAIGTIENQELGPKDTFYISLPLFHANGLFMQLYPCLIVGARAVVRARFSASNWLKDIRIYRATHTNLLGATAAFVAAQPETDQDKNHHLRVVAAAPLPADSESVFRHRFGIADVLPLYGMTEVNIPLYGQLGEAAPGTCGKVYEKWFEVEVRDPQTDRPVADGDTGEIMVRPKLAFGFMSGYAHMPEKTVEAWRNFWFHTGDAGYRRPDGYFVFVDRIKDSIRRRGENISSYEVEQALLGIEGVTEVAAYAVPAGKPGMEDEVMVTIMPGQVCQLDAEVLHQIALDALPKFAVPRYIRFVSDLPKTATGKIQKVVLREQGVTPDTWDALHDLIANNP